MDKLENISESGKLKTREYTTKVFETRKLVKQICQIENARIQFYKHNSFIFHFNGSNSWQCLRFMLTKKRNTKKRKKRVQRITVLLFVVYQFLEQLFAVWKRLRWYIFVLSEAISIIAIEFRFLNACTWFWMNSQYFYNIFFFF